MRTIRFRGKRLLDNKFVYGSLVQCLDGSVGIFCGDDFEHHKISAIKTSTICQLTGFHDRNGKGIYEGDILLWTRKNVHIEGRPLQDFSHKCVVYYDNDKCAFQFRCELRCGACVGYLDFDDDRADESFVEVIGNIHDNPELLEKGGEE